VGHKNTTCASLVVIDSDGLRTALYYVKEKKKKKSQI
jgi:hypothetical protein